MTGRIIKGIGGFYYVYTDAGIYTCKAKGAFRKDKIKPLVGDFVAIEPDYSCEMEAVISDILPRNNALVRPNVANIDQALIIFALKSPEPNFVTLDKMILQYRLHSLPVILCFNKDDLSDEAFSDKVRADYLESGCRIIMTSVVNSQGIDELKGSLNGKTTAVCGPSGAGKSSLINALSGGDVMETGIISRKLERGKHTTRHSEILPLGNDTYIMDTPGFSSFDLYDITAEELAGMYEEFDRFTDCRFKPCSHTHEPDCAVKDGVKKGLISQMRYDNYVYIYEELLKSRRY